MTLWTMGFLFTLGYLGKTKLRWWHTIATLALWPVFLGMEISGQLDDKDDTANKEA